MSLAAPDVSFLCDYVADKSGNMLRSGQADLVEARLEPVARQFGLENVHELVTELRRPHPQRMADRVAEAVTVNETSFFRDAHPFNAMRTSILPALDKPGSRIRIWCAACSTGQEPYSIAMLIKEHFPHLAARVRILATDLSEEVLDQARSGCFSQLEVNRGLPARSLVRFFDRQGTRWQAKSELRDLIDFRRLNLMGHWSDTGPFDIVFIRNVLVYFDQPGKADVLRRIASSMHMEGYLFIGSAETTIGLGVPLQRVEIDATVCYRPGAD